MEKFDRMRMAEIVIFRASENKQLGFPLID